MKPILAFICAMALSLTGCASPKSDLYLTQTPAYDLKAFFDGPLQGWGIVQDRSGRVIGRFDVRMTGQWTGDSGTLEEDFTYYEGKVQSPAHRTWRFKALGNGRFTGTADDVIGTATNETYGTAGNWRYQMDLPLGSTKLRVTFDDWMWQMRGGVVMNRSTIKKFGVRVADVTVFIQKVPPVELKHAP